MNIFGIISALDEKKDCRRLFIHPTVIKETFGIDPQYIVAELSYTADEISVLRARKLKKILKKANMLLAENGAEVVFLSNNIREIIQHLHPTLLPVYEKCYKIPPSRIFECFFELSKATNKNSKIRASNSLLISDNNLREVTLNNLSRLCMDAKHITIRTSHIDSAKRIADTMFVEYGILIKTEPLSPFSVGTTPYSLIDVDNGKIRIGDCVADGAEFESKSGPYLLDSSEEVAYLGEENFFNIKNLLSGKNKIKIS